jgi:hypothetical protein
LFRAQPEFFSFLLGFLNGYKYGLWSQWDIILPNVPLILKSWEIIFSFWENYFMGHFSGYFEGAVILTHCAQILALPLKIFVWPGCPDGIVLEVR